MPQRKFTDQFIYINDIVDGSRLRKITRTVGGASLDVCEFEPIQDSIAQRVTLTESLNREVEAGIILGGKEVVLHWGKVASLSTDEEGKVFFTSRLEPFHFGEEPLRGFYERNPRGGQAQPNNPRQDIPDTLVLNDNHLVFNPRIDDLTTHNRGPDKADLPFCAFLDPESIRTEAAQKYAGAKKAEAWTLKHAVLYLCGVLNRLEENVSNPKDADLQAVLDPSENLLENFWIPNGMHLPQALDHLLNPFGYCWFVEYIKRGERRIVVRKRGEGPAQELLFQAPGERLQTAASNTPAFHFNYNVSAATNRIDVLGDFRYVEATFTLIPAWDQSLDATGIEDLCKDTAAYQASPSLQRVYRDFVLGEAGDYIGTRKAQTAPTDLQAILGHPVVPKRRRFYPTLTQAADGTPLGELRGVDVQWSVDPGPGQSTFHALSELSEHPQVHLLQRECGIRFDGLYPPSEFWANGITSGADVIKIIVTATIRDDQRLFYSAKSQAASPLGVVHPLQLDASHRFNFRQLNGTSIYGSSVKSKFLTAATADDTDALKDFGTKINESWDMAEISGSAVIEGFDQTQYELCDVVTKVAGREISLNARPAPPNRYPQIVSITYDFHGHKRTLQLQTMREEHLTRALR